MMQLILTLVYRPLHTSIFEDHHHPISQSMLQVVKLGVFPTQCLVQLLSSQDLIPVFDTNPQHNLILVFNTNPQHSLSLPYQDPLYPTLPKPPGLQQYSRRTQ